jgi:hypothetical protein
MPAHVMSSDVAVARASGPAKCSLSNVPPEDVLSYLSFVLPPLTLSLPLDLSHGAVTSTEKIQRFSQP